MGVVDSMRTVKVDNGKPHLPVVGDEKLFTIFISFVSMDFLLRVMACVERWTFCCSVPVLSSCPLRAVVAVFRLSLSIFSFTRTTPVNKAFLSTTYPNPSLDTNSTIDLLAEFSVRGWPSSSSSGPIAGVG